MSLNENTIDRGYFTDIAKHVALNYQISEFYENYYEDSGYDAFLNKSKSVELCGKWWDMDYYKMQNVKDIKRVNLCKDKFCFNCQSMLASKRYLKYTPILDSFRNNYKVCHMIVTVPNCKGGELKNLLNKMYKKFSFFMRYFRGKARVKGVDFLQYGYGGLVRGLEITRNEREKSYHPHFHCMVLFRSDIDLTKEQINSYSFDHGRLVRKFSELEILLQKVWFLLMNDKKVTAPALAELKEGYSVVLDDSDGHYYECFKYSCKGAFDRDKGAFIYNERVFRLLYEALNNRRMIQGYGALHNFTDLDGELLEVDALAEYEQRVAQLRLIELPDFSVSSLDEILNDNKNCTYISKSNFKRLVAERQRLEQLENGIIE